MIINTGGRTDTVQYYTRWLLKRFEEGYVLSRNPLFQHKVTRYELTPDQVEGSISGDEAKLYRLIWSRFMASQMADCLMDTVSANITAGDYIFRASGFHVTFDGFTALYEEAADDKQKKETALPPLEVSQDLKLNKLSAEQKFTQPPPYYTEATLIHALEENGIGRPSTYAPIITTIVDRGYVEKEQKKLKTTREEAYGKNGRPPQPAR